MIVSDKYNLDLFRKIVGERAGYRCEMPDCGKIGENLNPHHFFSREEKSIRYDPLNGFWLCYGHHCFAHNNSREFRKIILYNKVRTQEWLDELIIRKNQIVKVNNSFREDWKEKLRAA